MISNFYADVFFSCGGMYCDPLSSGEIYARCVFFFMRGVASSYFVLFSAREGESTNGI